MNYLMRTTQVRPGSVPAFEERLGMAVAASGGSGKLAGCWHTEIGPLLQVVELWSFADGEAAVGELPSVCNELVQSIEFESLTPAPFMRPLDGTPQSVGPVFELRTYQTKTGEVPQMIEKWGAMVPGRETLSPLLGCWHSPLGRWHHLWPYSDLAERSRTRDEARQRKLWPPNTSAHLLTQASKLMLPASFSPLQ